VGSRKESLPPNSRTESGQTPAPTDNRQAAEWQGVTSDRYANEAPPAVAATADFVYTAVLKPSVGPRCHVVSAREAP
jgi:hypothetical protein